MSEKIKPALTAEEWKALEAKRNGVVIGIAMTGQGDEQISLQVHADDDGTDAFDFQYWDRDALAALALYGQPFGFTREDAESIRSAIRTIENEYGEDWFSEDAPLLHSLADRISALLPPEEK